jgi:TPR repeat protein
MIEEVIMHRFILALAVAVPLGGTALPALAQDAQASYEQGRKAFARDDLFGALEWLRKGADAGHAPSQALLAYILDRAEEDAAAIELYEKAAAQGDGDALYGLAGMYAGGEGVEQDPSRARELYERAAAGGHQRAQLVLALAYLRGGLDVEADPARGERMLREQAESGYQPAVDALARLERSR